MTIKVLIVDDELPARQRMRKLIKAEDDLELLGESEDAPDAVAKIGELKPDLVFLDIRLPGMSGLELGRMLHQNRSPYLIFATASGEHALEAFKVDAVDYLLKPFDQARFKQALEKVRKHMRAPAVSRRDVDVDQLLAKLTELTTGSPAKRKLALKVSTRLRLVDQDRIAYIQADRDYLHVVMINGDKSLVRGKISDVERQLAGSRFVRINRSVMLNPDEVLELKPHKRGDCEFVMKSGEAFRSGPTYRQRLRAWVDRL